MKSWNWIASVSGLTDVLTLLFLTACTSVPKIPANAEVFEKRVDTTVDSEAARHFIERYLPQKSGDRMLDEKLKTLNLRQDSVVPTRETLRAISEEFSVDVAALFLADRLLHDECNRALNNSFADFLNSNAPLATDAARYVLLFVPGWDYVESGHLTGANFAEPRKLAISLGIAHLLVALPPIASVEENARVLHAEILRQVKSGKKILIAGASSAGPAIHLALGELLSEKELASVKAWINLGGILQGSPLIDQFQSWPKRWLFDLGMRYMGWNRDAIMSMSVEQSRPRFQRMRKTPDLLIINYIGIPLSGQITRNASDKYPLLRQYGPNDGLTLLTDIIAPGSLSLVALGNDHFFAEDPEINRKTAAMMRMVFAYLGQEPAMQPIRRCVADQNK